MDACKCTSMWHGSTLNIRQAASLLKRLVEGEERWTAPEAPPPSVLPQNWIGTKPKRTVTCMVLKAVADDRHTTSPVPQYIL
ncbi:hypothetical protein TNCV_407991 [Trichonephila clavipes]|nr:hypothetical protein TNCV_407991 [Trichonephila clavipes]